MADQRYNLGLSGAAIKAALLRAALGGALDDAIAAAASAAATAQSTADTAATTADTANATAEYAAQAGIALNTYVNALATRVAALETAIGEIEEGGEGMVYNGLSIKNSYMALVDIYDLSSSSIDTGLDSITRFAIYKINAASSSASGITKGPAVSEGDEFTNLDGAVEIYAGDYSSQASTCSITAQAAGSTLTLTKTTTGSYAASCGPDSGDWFLILCIQDVLAD